MEIDIQKCLKPFKFNYLHQNASKQSASFGFLAHHQHLRLVSLSLQSRYQNTFSSNFQCVDLYHVLSQNPFEWVSYLQNLKKNFIKNKKYRNAVCTLHSDARFSSQTSLVNLLYFVASNLIFCSKFLFKIYTFYCSYYRYYIA